MVLPDRGLAVLAPHHVELLRQLRNPDVQNQPGVGQVGLKDGKNGDADCSPEIQLLH